jgi:large subunit ribosomal protein L18e
MPNPTGPSDPNLIALIGELRKNKNYKEIARQLAKPRRSKNAVNVSRLDKVAGKANAVAVAGKVLSAGAITKPINVYAWQFSKQAMEKIEKSGGKCFPLAMIKESKEKIMVIK